MNGADDLRTAIAQALTDADIAADVDLEGPGYYNRQADFVIARLADPVRRLAILEAMGLDTYEGQMWTKQAPSGSRIFPEWVCTNGVFEPAWSEANQESSDVLVVRPRGASS